MAKGVAGQLAGRGHVACNLAAVPDHDPEYPSARALSPIGRPTSGPLPAAAATAVAALLHGHPLAEAGWLADSRPAARPG